MAASIAHAEQRSHSRAGAAAWAHFSGLWVLHGFPRLGVELSDFLCSARPPEDPCKAQVNDP